MVIEAFGMDETAAAIQNVALTIGWTLDLINAQLTTLKNAKVTAQLDDKSVLEIKGLHQDLLAEQKLGIKEYKLEQKETFAQYKRELKEIVHEHGVWLSERALIIAIVTIEAVIFLLGTLAYYYAKAKFTYKANASAIAEELKERNRQGVIDDSFLSWILVLSMRRCTTSFTGKTGTNINKNA